MIQAIKEYWFDLDTYTNEWPNSEFQKMSYSRWAVDEILTLIRDHPQWSPVRAVEEFRKTVTEYYNIPTHHDDVRKIFNIAMSTASDISDILTAMQ